MFTDKQGQAFVSDPGAQGNWVLNGFYGCPGNYSVHQMRGSAPKFPGDTTAAYKYFFEGGTFEHATVMCTNDP